MIGSQKPQPKRDPYDIVKVVANARLLVLTESKLSILRNHSEMAALSRTGLYIRSPHHASINENEPNHGINSYCVLLTLLVSAAVQQQSLASPLQPQPKPGTLLIITFADGTSKTLRVDR